jgi:hypothetical protein
MSAVVYAFLSTLGALFRFQLSLQAEIVALRHQLAAYKRSVRRLHVGPRPYPMDLVVAPLGLMAGGTGLRSARNRDRLAAKTLS